MPDRTFRRAVRVAAALAAALAAPLAAPLAAASRAASAQAPPAPVTPRSLYEAGERALAGHHYVDAERAYEALRTLQPDVAEVHARLGLIYFQEGKFADAVPTIRRALTLNPALPNLDALLAM